MDTSQIGVLNFYHDVSQLGCYNGEWNSSFKSSFNVKFVDRFLSAHNAMNVCSDLDMSFQPNSLTGGGRHRGKSAVEFFPGAHCVLRVDCN